MCVNPFPTRASVASWPGAGPVAGEPPDHDDRRKPFDHRAERPAKQRDRPAWAPATNPAIPWPVIHSSDTQDRARAALAARLPAGIAARRLRMAAGRSARVGPNRTGASAAVSWSVRSRMIVACPTILRFGGSWGARPGGSPAQLLVALAGLGRERVDVVLEAPRDVEGAPRDG